MSRDLSFVHTATSMDGKGTHMPTTTASTIRGNEYRHQAASAFIAFTRQQAHEIRNPLNAIRMQAAVIRHKIARPSPGNLEVARDQLERLDQEVLRIDALLKRLLEFGRDPAGCDEAILAEIVADES